MTGKRTGRPNGRPTKYTPELADEICSAIESSEKGLQHLCNENPHWPERANIFIWLRKYPEFQFKYTQAKESQVEVNVDYIQEMANEPHHYIDDIGNERVDVSLLRVKIDALKWKAAKLKPKKYGDRIEIEQKTEENERLKAELLELKAKLDAQHKKDY